MQIRLNTNELAYLLHTHGSQSVPGLDDTIFFPKSENELRSLRSDGFSALQENGWLIPEGNSFHTNVAAMLLTAVLAAPEWVLVVNRVVPDRGKQLLTYSRAEGFWVEQFQMTEDDRYILTLLDDRSVLLNRLYEAFGVADVHSSAETFTIDTTQFDAMLNEKAAQTTRVLPDSLEGSTSGPAQLISQFQRHGRLQTFTATAVGDLRVDADIVLARDGQHEIWVIRESSSAKVVLVPLTKTRLAEMLDEMCLPIRN